MHAQNEVRLRRLRTRLGVSVLIPGGACTRMNSSSRRMLQCRSGLLPPMSRKPNRLFCFWAVFQIPFFESLQNSPLFNLVPLFDDQFKRRAEVGCTSLSQFEGSYVTRQGTPRDPIFLRQCGCACPCTPLVLNLFSAGMTAYFTGGFVAGLLFAGL